MNLTIPLFPLNTVLFPDGVLPLRIFEPRYLDMISECLKSECGIGVILIKEGSEAGCVADTHDIGTLSHISYWNKRPDGLLGVTLKGSQRFRVLTTQVEPNQLVRAEVEVLSSEEPEPLPEHYRNMSELLKKIISQLEPPFSTMGTSYDNANWVGARLVELLPIDLQEKQRLLSENNPTARLNEIEVLLAEMDIW